MTDRSQLRFDRSPNDLDDLTAERLVRGLDASDAPPGYRGAAETLTALRGPGTAAELAAEASVVDAMAGLTAAPRNDRPHRRLAPKLVALVAAGGVLSMAAAAAAATGSLPAPVQHAVAGAVAPFIDLPVYRSSTTKSTRSTVPTAGATVSTTAPSLLAKSPETTDASPSRVQDTSSSASAPAAVTCLATGNHGANVSTVARQPASRGHSHGGAVSAMAQSDCGKPAGQPGGAQSQTSTTTTPTTSAAGPPATPQPAPPDNNGNGHAPGSPSNGHGHG